MLSFPNARITIGLQVKAKRNDGYHNIETLMLPVSMHDALEVVPAVDGRAGFRLSGLDVPGSPAENLVLQAVDLIQREHLLRSGRSAEALPPLHIYLRKGIPPGSGLAGGSSDAVFMLRLFDSYFNLNLCQRRLDELAAELGSDCPFFLRNKPMLASGRGELLEAIHIPDIYNYHPIIIIPPIHINTQKAYKKICPNPERQPLKAILEQPVADWQDLLTNDFEVALFTEHPYLQKIKVRLLKQGATYASLSGSGSALFGLFSDPGVLYALRNEFHDCLTGIYRWLL